jgi:hypothetical protein
MMAFDNRICGPARGWWDYVDALFGDSLSDTPRHVGSNDQRSCV